MRFVLLNGGWEVSFLEADLTISLPPKLTFPDSEAIRELARRGQALRESEARALLEYALSRGYGGIYLDLTPEQYAIVKTTGHPP